MSVTTVTATTITREGVTVSSQNSDTTNGNQLSLTGFEMIEITNSDSGSHSVTFVAQSSDSRGNKTNKTVAIGASGVKVFGPFQKADWADANGYLQITWSSGTGTYCGMRIFQNLTSNPASQTE